MLNQELTEVTATYKKTVIPLSEQELLQIGTILKAKLDSLEKEQDAKNLEEL